MFKVLYMAQWLMGALLGQDHVSFVSPKAGLFNSWVYTRSVFIVDHGNIKRTRLGLMHVNIHTRHDWASVVIFPDMEFTYSIYGEYNSDMDGFRLNTWDEPIICEIDEHTMDVFWPHVLESLRGVVE